MVLPRWTKGTAATSALPASLALLGGFAPAPAQAAPGPDLRILSPRANDALGSANFLIDVSYQSRSGVLITAAEVWVDGVRWLRRDLDKAEVQKRGVLSFDVDGSTLSQGAHTVVVTVFDAIGAASSATVKIVAGNNAGASSGALGGPQMAFVSPGNGKRVSGTIELNVDAKDKGGANPYVTFFIDKEFKTLKNYPPYSYVWDTTGTGNGWHTVEAMAYVEGSTLTSTQRLRVYVDNPGGNTARLDEIPDLAAAASAPKTAPGTAKPLAIPLPKAPRPGPLTSAPAAKPAPVRVARADFARPAPVPSAAPAAKTPAPSRLAPPAPAAPHSAGPASPAAPAATVYGVRPLPLKTAQRPPILSAASVAPALRVAPQVDAAPARSLRTPRATVRRVAAPALSSGKGADGALQVAFNGERIAFDVPPRVEAGLSLTPFRHLFEHTGGVVSWVPSTRIVRAVNADREIVLAIGKPTARVNGQAISLQKPPFLEQGRAIVPLSFMGEALDVDIQYDPATGRLQITSK